MLTKSLLASAHSTYGLVFGLEAQDWPCTQVLAPITKFSVLNLNV